MKYSDLKKKKKKNPAKKILESNSGLGNINLTEM